MIHFPRGLALAALISLAACSGGGQSSSSLPAMAGGTGTQSLAQSPQSILQSTFPQNNFIRSCNVLRAGEEVLCNALQRTDVMSREVNPNAVAGYGPADIHTAYNIPNTGGTGQTIAVVDAQDNPNAESDLAVYRSHFGLPACTTANGCFQKLNQTGQAGNYPTPDPNWGAEIALDLDMASATCPACKIILVEANSATFNNLGISVDTAVTKGADAVSNSYGGSEFNASNKHYNHAKHVIVASSGDSGYSAGPQQPCSYSSVVCVGGTTLRKGGGTRGWTETVWSGGGSGCSALVAKPAWQHDTGCTKRTETDISAVADPNTGVAVYDTYGTGGTWLVFGGTSVSSPIIGTLYALAGNAEKQTAAKGLYTDAGKHTFDITVGSNGSCSPSYLCHAGTGWDGPTGWGTPNGIAAF